MFLQRADGLAWTPLKDKVWSGGGLVRDVTFGNGRYLAVESFGRILVRPNGKKWRVSALIRPIRRGLSSVVFAGGIFLALKADSCRFHASKDGDLWVCHGRPGRVAVGIRAGRPVAARSVDGDQRS